MEKYDLAVIGGGPGGYVAAIKGAQLGMKTLLFEKENLGGVCLNKGCIPTKTLLHSAQMLSQTRHWQELGLSCGQVGFDMEAMIRRKEAVVDNMRQGIAGLLKANKVQVINAAASVRADQLIEAEGVEYEAENIIVATGSRPLLPPVPGLDLPDVVTSDDMLEGAFYKELLIIGGGVIGMEFACLYQALGCKVTVVEAMDRLLPTLDRELGQNLSMIMKKRGVEIHTSCRVQRIEKSENGLRCIYTCKDKEEQTEAEGILVAIGRKGCWENVFGTDIPIEGGRIVVDEHHRTAMPHVYAIGDVAAGDIQLAHAASAAAIAVVCHIAGVPMQIDSKVVPSCIFTDPEIAVAGLDADTAKAMGIKVKTSKYLMGGNGKSVIEMADRGFVKLVCDEES